MGPSHDLSLYIVKPTYVADLKVAAITRATKRRFTDSGKRPPAQPIRARAAPAPAFPDARLRAPPAPVEASTPASPIAPAPVPRADHPPRAAPAACATPGP